MKILGIVGSPRMNGNTHVLVGEILNGAASAGAETETILLGDLTIGECTGCHTCWKGYECVRKDDMNRLYGNIAASDIIVFGTPVYWYGPTALMKAFLDRFVYFNSPENRPKVRGKKALLAIPFEDETPETAAITVAMFEKSFAWLELNHAGAILAPGVDARGDMQKQSAVMKKAYELGRSIAAS